MKLRILTLGVSAMMAMAAFAPAVGATPSNQAGPSNGNADFLGQGKTTADKAPASRPGNS